MSAQIPYHMLNFSSPYLSTVVIKDMIPKGWIITYFPLLHTLIMSNHKKYICSHHALTFFKFVFFSGYLQINILKAIPNLLSKWERKSESKKKYTNWGLSGRSKNLLGAISLRYCILTYYQTKRLPLRGDVILPIQFSMYFRHQLTNRVKELILRIIFVFHIL